MRDMKEGINKAIDSYDEHGVYVELTAREKELIEYGYIQCSLHIGYDMCTKGESFILGLQEMVIKNEAILQEENENSIYGICERILNITEDEIKEIEQIYTEQLNYVHTFKLATQKKQHKLGEYNKKVIDKLKDVKLFIEKGKTEE